MRLLIRLRSLADSKYDNTYHDALRSRIWKALENTKYEKEHDKNRPAGFCFSNPFPPKDLHEGDKRTLLVSAPQESLLTHVARDLLRERKLNIGEMPFRVEEVSELDPDVGEPGTRGVIETGTGVVCRIPQRNAKSYDIEPEGTGAIYWRPKHTLRPFRSQIQQNLDRKHRLFCQDYLPAPCETDFRLFNSYDLIKTYALPVTVTTDQELTYVVSKWRLGYTVQNDDHRRHLNLALDTGLGERNALGFGFINIVEAPTDGGLGGDQ
jgi:CRISPR-associated endoribonuclease Cas6